MARLGRPRLGTDLIERQRLFAALDAGLEVPLTLLSAPAGSGKTALLLTWLARREGQLRIAGLSLRRSAGNAAARTRSSNAFARRDSRT